MDDVELIEPEEVAKLGCLVCNPPAEALQAFPSQYDRTLSCELGDVPEYTPEIYPPHSSCFSQGDQRVRALMNRQQLEGLRDIKTADIEAHGLATTVPRTESMKNVMVPRHPSKDI
ncbi:hypothetical protein ACFLUT_02045 [Chloroflexota bacterium]